MRVHVVKKGDTMWLIAKKYGISLESLIAANPQIPDPNRIDVGMRINIPGGADMETNHQMPIKKMEPPYMGPTCPPVKKEDHYVKPICPPEEKAETGWPKHLKTITYIVKAGDTLFKIAKNFGIPLEKLISANPQIQDPDKIDVGQKVFVPKEIEKCQHYCPMDEVKEHCPMPQKQQHCPMPMPQEHHYYYQQPEEHHYHYMQPEEHNYFTMQCPTMQCPTMECPTMQMMMYYMPMPYYMPYYIPYYVPQYVPYSMPKHDMPKSKCKSDHDWNLCHSSS